MNVGTVSQIGSGVNIDAQPPATASRLALRHPSGPPWRWHLLQQAIAQNPPTTQATPWTDVQ